MTQDLLNRHMHDFSIGKTNIFAFTGPNTHGILSAQMHGFSFWKMNGLARLQGQIRRQTILDTSDAHGDALPRFPEFLDRAAGHDGIASHGGQENSCQECAGKYSGWRPPKAPA